ncbi:hypothetical protein JCM10207_000608 [Rhodosporidiobolus poonsookiae]
MPTPRRKKIQQPDDDFGPSSPSPASPSRNSPAPSRSTTPLRSAYAIAQANAPGAHSAPAAARKERGPVGLDQETAYHQRLRQLLLEHKKARAQWSQLVVRGLVGRVRGAMDIWTDVEIALKAIEKHSPSAGAIRAGYLFAQSARLSEQVAAVEGVFANLQEIAAAFSSISDRAEWLLLEASRTRGVPFAFQQPLWVTWPLSRFVDGLIALSSPYHDSLALIRSLLDTLLTFPPLPSASTPPSSSSASGPVSVTATADSSSSSSPSTATKDAGGAPQERPSNELLQASMSLLVVQPLLPGKLQSGGSEAWEEVLSVEVGGWA